MNKEQLFAYILTQDREDLLNWLEQLWRESDERERKKLFRYMQRKKETDFLTPATLI